MTYGEPAEVGIQTGIHLPGAWSHDLDVVEGDGSLRKFLLAFGVMLVSRTQSRVERERASACERNRRYYYRNPEKVAAHRAVANALKDGTLRRLPCRKCGNAKTEAHHPDYSKFLDVEWYCRACHKAHHAAIKRAAGCPRSSPLLPAPASGGAK